MTPKSAQTRTKLSLPVGTVIQTKTGEWDQGIMSWDETNTEIRRVAVAGSTGVIINARQTSDGYVYETEFLPSEVCVLIDEAETLDASKYEIVKLGLGFPPKWHRDYYSNSDRERDPFALEQIATNQNRDAPSI